MPGGAADANADNDCDANSGAKLRNETIRAKALNMSDTVMEKKKWKDEKIILAEQDFRLVKTYQLSSYAATMR